MNPKEVVSLGPCRKPPIIIMDKPPDVPVESQSLPDPKIK